MGLLDRKEALESPQIVNRAVPLAIFYSRSEWPNAPCALPDHLPTGLAMGASNICMYCETWRRGPAFVFSRSGSRDFPFDSLVYSLACICDTNDTTLETGGTLGRKPRVNGARSWWVAHVDGELANALLPPVFRVALYQSLSPSTVHF